MISQLKRRRGKLINGSKRKEARTNSAFSLSSNGDVEVIEITIVNSDFHKELVVFDGNLLERAKTQWLLGNWETLASLNREKMQYNPDRDKIALLTAAAKLQLGKFDEARALARLALDWGVDRKLLSKILVSGATNTLGRLLLVGGQSERAIECFDESIKASSTKSETRSLSAARADSQIRQLAELLPDDVGSLFLKEKSYLLLQTCNEDLNSTKHADNKTKELSVSDYWEKRYVSGRNSGAGSYGRLAAFKADIVNTFIKDKQINKIIEFGSGDGHQLSLFCCPEYIGIDVSTHVIQICKERFKDDQSKLFLTLEEFMDRKLSAELTLSLDVIYHLTEVSVFESYMRALFDASQRYCIIYACNEEEKKSDSIHVHRRKFTNWIEKNMPCWRLVQIIFNRFPWKELMDSKNSSISDFYFYEKRL